VFVEDTAVVLDELAVMTRPGAESRRAELPGVADALKHHRRLAYIDAPGTLDGGDVIIAGQLIFVGESVRTNAQGIAQLKQIASRLGYEVRPVRVAACLHLKSAVTVVDDFTLLINQAWVAGDAFRDFELIDVDPSEPPAANIVRVGNRLLYSAAFPLTRHRLDGRGLNVTAVDVSEIAKAEGAVTCCSLIFKEQTCLSVA
jgi:dimethylargininase